MQQKWTDDMIGFMFNACKNTEREDRSPQKVVDKLEKHFVRANSCMNALEEELSHPKKVLTPENMRLETLRGDGSVMGHFRILRPSFVSEMEQAYETGGESTQKAILKFVLPHIQNWLHLIGKFTTYYEDKTIGETLRYKFNELQGRCKWFSSEPLRCVKHGRLVSEDYAEAYAAFASYYRKLPRASHFVEEDELIRAVVVNQAVKYAEEREAALKKGKVKTVFNLTQVVKDFYNDIDRWATCGWYVGGKRLAYGDKKDGFDDLYHQVWYIRDKYATVKEKKKKDVTTSKPVQPATGKPKGKKKQ